MSDSCKKLSVSTFAMNALQRVTLRPRCPPHRDASLKKQLLCSIALATMLASPVFADTPEAGAWSTANKATFEGFAFAFALTESAHFDAQWCEKKHPEFAKKNAEVLAGMEKYRLTGEQFIEQYAAPDLNPRLLGYLREMRTTRASELSQHSEKRAFLICSDFLGYLEPSLLVRPLAK